MIYVHKVRVIFAVCRQHVMLLWVGMEVPAPPGSSPNCGCFRRSACATAAGLEAPSTPREASCVAALLNAPLPMSYELQELADVSGGAAAFGLCVYNCCSRCARLRVLRATWGLSTLRPCMSTICSPFPHCCSLAAATSPPPPPIVVRLYGARVSLLVLWA
jgi:hypothetical protein